MKNKGGKRAKINPYADLEGEVDHFDMDESDDELGKDGRILLDKAKGRQKKPQKETVFNIYHSSEDEDDDDDDDEEEMVEDEEGAEDVDDDGEMSDLEDDLDKPADNDDGLPDSKAWGTKRKSYYDTDYVDKDFSGFDDEEAALMEEQEANEIQKRILAQLEQTDFSLGLLDKVEDKKKEATKKTFDFEIEKEKVEKDLTKLTQQELIEVIKRETPGFFSLLKHCKVKLKYLEEQILPLLEMEKSGELPECEALTFLQTYKKIVKFYLMNAAFLILLKCKRQKTDGHPVVKRLGQIAVYLNEMDNCLSAGLGKQINKLLNDKNQGLAIVEKSGVKPSLEIQGNRKERRKVQQLLKAKAEKEQEAIDKKKRKLLSYGDERIDESIMDRVTAKETVEDNEDDEEMEEGEEGEIEKRAATYKMIKNKGLTPKRKKEVRNPRVRNRNKYKKAVIRRKGQVREVKKELRRYDGEFSGIKKDLSKSVKIK